MVRLYKYTIQFLVLVLVLVIVVISQLPDGNLHIIACDVGQGDAILITFKNIQILTDGGPDRKVLDCLGKYLPFYDRDIELVISTHPDADHSTGLIDIIQKYNVGAIFINPIDSGTQTIKALENAVGSRGVRVVSPTEGQSYRLDLIYLDILNPTDSQIQSLNQKVGDSSLGFYVPIEATNEYSISYKLSFKKFSGIFTGDFQNDVSDRISLNPAVGHVDYIKIPHHGSRNGLSENLLKSSMPKLAVISVGRNNKYGHPNQEILNMLLKYGVKLYRTDEMGDIKFVTDGEKFWVK